MASRYEREFDPVAVLKHPEFKVLEGPVKRDPKQNIACAYAPQKQLHLIQKPVPTAGPGQVVVHVRSTGICT